MAGHRAEAERRAIPPGGDASVPLDGAFADGSGGDGAGDGPTGDASDAADANTDDQCRFTCADPFAPGGRCPVGEACCHAIAAGASLSTRCTSRVACSAGGGNIQPGTSVCCKGNDECPGGVCCGDQAYTFTACRTACGSSERRVCKSSSECPGCGPLGPPYAWLMYCP